MFKCKNNGNFDEYCKERFQVYKEAHEELNQLDHQKVEDYFKEFKGCYKLPKQKVDKCLKEWEVMVEIKNKIKGVEKRIKKERQREFDDGEFEEMLEKKIIPDAIFQCDELLQAGVDIKSTTVTLYSHDYKPHIGENYFKEKFKYGKYIAVDFNRSGTGRFDSVNFKIRCRDLREF